MSRHRCLLLIDDALLIYNDRYDLKEHLLVGGVYDKEGLTQHRVCWYMWVCALWPNILITDISTSRSFLFMTRTKALFVKIGRLN